MFIDATTALRIERAEARVMRDMVGVHVGSARAPTGFMCELGPGLATYLRRESPLNKMIGFGIDEPINDALLASVERAFHENGEPARAEISTLAVPETYAHLTARRYRLLGFENVLARSLSHHPLPHDSTIRIDRVTDEATLSIYRDAEIEASAHPDDTGVVVDQLSRGTLEAAVDDLLVAPGFQRYLAYRDGRVAGAASMHVHDGVAMLTGAATMPSHRRRGVQAAFLATRLGDARAAGAELAVITTAPGTRSQANVMKLGFSLIYARAILTLAR
jgi:GNAT superfamily N-acetyltransferase